jgi:hypothetical protein
MDPEGRNMRRLMTQDLVKQQGVLRLFQQQAESNKPAFRVGTPQRAAQP